MDLSSRIFLLCYVLEMSMPKFYTYQSQSGGYIQTQIHDQPQTLQVAPSAAALFEDLGYDYGEYIPRDVTKPLIILGVLETKPRGRSRHALLAGSPTLSVEYCELTDDQQTTLRDYIRARVVDLSGPTYELLDEFLTVESPLESIPHQPEPPSASEAAPQDGPPKHPKSTANGIDLTAIPGTLRELDQWVCWREEQRDGKPTKVPVSPHEEGFGKVNDPATWASFAVAVDALSRDDVTGLGFVFTKEDTIAGVDLDDVRDPKTGTLSDRATDIVSTLDSYTEVSPSGTGLHVLLQGFVPDGRSRNAGIELYDSGRFFTVTGDQVSDTPSEVAVRHDELAAVHSEYVAREDRDSPAPENGGIHSIPPKEEGSSPAPNTELSPDEIIEYGTRNRKFRRLWNGDWSGYESQSEADLAFCVLLAYYSGDDTAIMDSVFRRSNLMREKWDEMRGDQTYGEMTMTKAVRIVDSYDPHLHGMEAAAPETDIARLEPEQKVTIEATVEIVDEVPTEEIEQAGELADDTGRIRFVVWASEYWDPAVSFKRGKTYRLADAWVTEYKGQREVHINEHTAIEEVS
jgi:hypothetical protein